MTVHQLKRVCDAVCKLAKQPFAIHFNATPYLSSSVSSFTLLTHSFIHSVIHNPLLSVATSLSHCHTATLPQLSLLTIISLIDDLVSLYM
jgi:hypothetical protein